jgi:phage tail-like protein
MRSAAIEHLLPHAFQRAATPGSVLRALLEVMEGMHAPTERRLEAVEDLFAPYRAPDGFTPFLASWVALDHLAEWAAPADAASAAPLPAGRLRHLVATAAATAQWRGTAHGLQRMVTVATGVDGIEVWEPPDRPFHVVVRLPPAARGQVLLVRRLVEVEKPAFVSCDVIVDHGGDVAREDFEE